VVEEKIHFAFMGGTQKTWFSIRNNEPQNISFERGAEDNTNWAGMSSEIQMSSDHSL
jgi:hypothetical protein